MISFLWIPPCLRDGALVVFNSITSDGDVIICFLLLLRGKCFRLPRSDDVAFTCWTYYCRLPRSDDVTLACLDMFKLSPGWTETESEMFLEHGALTKPIPSLEMADIDFALLPCTVLLGRSTSMH